MNLEEYFAYETWKSQSLKHNLLVFVTALIHGDERDLLGIVNKYLKAEP